MEWFWTLFSSFGYLGGFWWTRKSPYIYIPYITWFFKGESSMNEPQNIHGYHGYVSLVGGNWLPWILFSHLTRVYVIPSQLTNSYIFQMGAQPPTSGLPEEMSHLKSHALSPSAAGALRPRAAGCGTACGGDRSGGQGKCPLRQTCQKCRPKMGDCSWKKWVWQKWRSNHWQYSSLDRVYLVNGRQHLGLGFSASNIWGDTVTTEK